MKKLITPLVFSLLFLFNVNGQTPSVAGQNVFKWNVSAVAISTYSFQYERVLDPLHSFAIGFGITPDVDLPFKQDLLDAFGDNADAKRAIESTKFRKITITPEYRFYTGVKGAPGGFYVAPFARYMHMSLNQDYTFTPSNGVLHVVPIEGKFTGYGAGVMIGTQWLVGSSVTIDLWIAGPFFGVMNASFHGTGYNGDMTAADKAKLESDIESVKIPLWPVDATVGDNVIDAKLSGPYYGFRTLGLCVGFRF